MFGNNSIDQSKLNAIVGIPAHNEENTIVSIILKALKYVNDVVVVDDGSTDKTAELAEETGAIVLKHRKHLGYDASLRSLILYAREIDKAPLVIIDGKAKYPTKKIPIFLKKMVEEDVDIIIGSRFLLDNDKTKLPIHKRFGIKVLKLISTTRFQVGEGKVKKITDTQSSFLTLSQNALKSLDISDSIMDVFSEILEKSSELNVEEVPISVFYETKTLEKSFIDGLGFIGSLLKYTECKQCILSFGISGLLGILLSIYLGIRTFNIYSEMGYWPLGYLFVTILLFFTGLVAIVIGLIVDTAKTTQRRWT